MAQTYEGRIKQFCKKNNIEEELYHSQISKGFKWCTGCKGWHSIKKFGKDSSRFDGMSATCLIYRKKLHKKKYIPKPRKSKKGERFVPPRDNDKKQARHRVNHLVEIGLLPNPNSLSCVDCGHDKKSKIKRRHEYDHYMGYSIKHQETVEPVCTKCHRKRHKTNYYGNKD